MKNLHLINLTPHAVNICDDNGDVVLTLPPSGEVARVTTKTVSKPSDLGFNFATVEYGEVENLPASDYDTVYVVSGIVRTACKYRYDIASPGELIRDAAGQPVGCKGLVVNAFP